MAYQKRYNPDALPAHAEPDQAAQMLSNRPHSNSQPAPPPQQQSGPPNYNKPHPPLRPSMQQGPPSNGGRGRGSGYGSAGYSQGPPPAGAVPPTAGGPPPHARYGSVSSPPLQPEDFSRPPPQQRYNNYGFSPPPQHQAFGAPPPPPQGYHNRPPVSSRPPSSPIVARDASEASLIPLFQAVDKNGSGELSERELGAALINGDWTPFDPHTVRMMIRMFDSDRDGTIGFSEFCGLWNFLASWRALFDRFDEDRSGNISFDEYSKALVAFGYRLTPQFVQTLFRTYDKRGANAISFDVFVQSCISLKRMTDVFKKYDDDRDGYITLSFEEFLTEIIRQR